MPPLGEIIFWAVFVIVILGVILGTDDDTNDF